MSPNISLDDIDENGDCVTATKNPSETAAPEPAASERQTTDETPPVESANPAPAKETQTPPVADTAKPQVAVLPSTLKSAIAALQKAEALPQATKAQKAERDAQLARLRPHVARLQEGVPTPILTAKDLGNYHHQLVTSAKRERLELLARSSPEIAELLKERDALAAEIAKVLADCHQK